MQIPANLISSEGLNTAAAISMFYNQVEVRTSVTPTLRFPISSDGQPPSPFVQQLLNQLQPTVILSGPAGEVVLAPYGQAQGQSSWLPLALFGAGAVLFIGWAVWGK